MPTYVYGLATPEAAPRGSGIDGAAIRVLADGGVGAIVSTIAAGSVDADRPNLMAHSDVLQGAVGPETIVPMRFGTVFADDDAVRSELLEARRSELTEVLDRVRGQVELTVKAYYVQETVL